MLTSAIIVFAQQGGKAARRPTAAAAAPAGSDTLYQAEEAMARRDYARAEQLLRETQAKSPNNDRVWFDLGFVANATGREAEAVEAYRKAAALKPDAFETNLNLGILLGRKNDPEAEKFLRAATALKPTKDPEQGLARAWISLGRVMAESKPADATAAFREAVKLTPRDPAPHIALGEALERSGDLAAAEAEFKQAAALDPKSSEALAGLVNLYSRTKRFAEGEAALRKYLQLEPTNNHARVQLARLLGAQGRAGDAAGELESALRCKGAACGDSSADATAAAIRELAGLYAQAQRYTDAEALYRALATRAPADAGLHYALGTLLMNQRRFADAQPELVKAVELKPDFAEAYGNLAVVAAENKDYPVAIRALDRRAGYAPETAATYFLRATSYDHLRDPKQAAANYHQFLAASGGRNPDQEWQARHRLIAIEKKK